MFCVIKLVNELNCAVNLFEQGEDEEGEESEAGRGQQAGLLHGQHRLPV